MNPFMGSPAHFAQSLLQHQQNQQNLHNQQSQESNSNKSNEEGMIDQNSMKHGADLLASLGFPPFKMPRLDLDNQPEEEEEEEIVDMENRSENEEREFGEIDQEDNENEIELNEKWVFLKYGWMVI